MNLKKLTTPRLLALFKKKRKILFSKRGLLDEWDGTEMFETYADDIRKLQDEVDEIKTELGTREHVVRK